MDADRDRGLTAGGVLVAKVRPKQRGAFRPSIQSVGRTPWSARVPLDPLFALPNQPRVIPERPTGWSAADQGVRPTQLTG